MAIAQEVMGFALVELEEVHDITQAVAGQSLAPEALVLKGHGERRAVFAKIRTLVPRCIFDPCQKRDRAVMFLKYLCEAFQSLLPDSFANCLPRAFQR
jgi:hypothetical protein